MGYNGRDGGLLHPALAVVFLKEAQLQKQNKTTTKIQPTSLLRLTLWMLLIVVILLKQLRIIKKMTQRASMENWQL